MDAKNRTLIPLVLLILAVFVRLIPHPWGFTPIGAMALFGGARFRRKPWIAFGVPLGALLAGDTLLELLTGYGFHSGMPVVYGSFAVTVVIGLLIGARGASAPLVAAGAASSAILFYLSTNFWMWTVSAMYPPTMAGLAACYVAGLPFLGNHLAGDLLYSAALFGAAGWLERRRTARAVAS